MSEGSRYSFETQHGAELNKKVGEVPNRNFFSEFAPSRSSKQIGRLSAQAETWDQASGSRVHEEAQGQALDQPTLDRNKITAEKNRKDDIEEVSVKHTGGLKRSRRQEAVEEAEKAGSKGHEANLSKRVRFTKAVEMTPSVTKSENLGRPHQSKTARKKRQHYDAGGAPTRVGWADHVAHDENFEENMLKAMDEYLNRRRYPNLEPISQDPISGYGLLPVSNHGYSPALNYASPVSLQGLIRQPIGMDRRNRQHDPAPLVDLTSDTPRVGESFRDGPTDSEEVRANKKRVRDLLEDSEEESAAPVPKRHRSLQPENSAFGSLGHGVATSVLHKIKRGRRIPQVNRPPVQFQGSQQYRNMKLVQNTMLYSASSAATLLAPSIPGAMELRSDLAPQPFHVGDAPVVPGAVSAVLSARASPVPVLPVPVSITPSAARNPAHDFREVAPPTEWDCISLSDALQYTRDAFEEWTGRPPPLTNRVESYAEQYRELRAIFRAWWRSDQNPRSSDPIPWLFCLPAWFKSITNWKGPVKDAAFYEPSRSGFFAERNSDGTLVDPDFRWNYEDYDWA